MLSFKVVHQGIYVEVVDFAFLGQGGSQQSRVAFITLVYLDSDNCSSLMKPFSMRFLFSTMPLEVWFQLIRVPEQRRSLLLFLGSQEGWREGDISSPFPSHHLHWGSWRDFLHRISIISACPVYRFRLRFRITFGNIQIQGRQGSSFPFHEITVTCQPQEFLPPTCFLSPN